MTMTLALALASLLASPDPQILAIEKRFEAAKPTEKSLAFYSLDWAMSLAEAKERAANEHRPIFLILNTNITAGTNFFSGHT